MSSFYAIVPAHIYMLSKLHLYSYSHTIFNHNFVQSGHCAGGNKRSTLGHGSSDIPSHIAQVGVQEAKNVRGAAEQCAHAQGVAGERERESKKLERAKYICDLYINLTELRAHEPRRCFGLQDLRGW